MPGTMTGPACPACGGEMYDNRATKKNPRQPDFKCKDYKAGCQGVIWPPKPAPVQNGGRQTTESQTGSMTKQATTYEDLPGDPANTPTIKPFEGIAQRYEETLRHVIKNVVPILTNAGIVVDAQTIAAISAHINITRTQKNV